MASILHVVRVHGHFMPKKYVRKTKNVKPDLAKGDYST